MSPGQDDQTVIEAEIIPDGSQARLIVEERGLPLDEVAAHLADRPAADWRSRWT